MAYPDSTDLADLAESRPPDPRRAIEAPSTIPAWGRWGLAALTGIGLCLATDTLNQTLELPFFVKGYVSLMATQTGIIGLYFLLRALKRRASKPSSMTDPRGTHAE